MLVVGTTVKSKPWQLTRLLYMQRPSSLHMRDPL